MPAEESAPPLRAQSPMRCSRQTTCGAREHHDPARGNVTNRERIRGALEGMSGLPLTPQVADLMRQQCACATEPGHWAARASAEAFA